MDKPLLRIINTVHRLNEDVPVNNVSSGNISGANEDPPVNKKKKKNIYLGMGSRVQWLRNLKKNGQG